MAEDRVRRRKNSGLEGTPQELARWKGAAQRRGLSFAALARELLDQAALGTAPGGVDPPRDPEFVAALELVGRAFSSADNAAAIRSAVVTMAKLIRRRVPVMDLAEGPILGEETARVPPPPAIPPTRPSRKGSR